MSDNRTILVADDDRRPAQEVLGGLRFEVGGELGVDVPPAGVDGPDHLGERAGRRGLGQEPDHARGQCPLEVSGPAVAGHDDDPR